MPTPAGCGTAIMVLSGFAIPGAADFGWFAYLPLNDRTHSPGIGGDLWTVGLIVSGLSTILGAVNMITTVVWLRAHGMTSSGRRSSRGTSWSPAFWVLLAFPILTADLFVLLADRHLGAHVFDPQRRRDRLAAPPASTAPPRVL